MGFILKIIAAICFFLAAVGFSAPVGLVAMGLFLYVLAELIGGAGISIGAKSA